MEEKDLESVLKTYKNNLKETISKVDNNINYIDSYEGSFIAANLMTNLENIMAEYDKIKKLVDTYKID